MSKVKTMPPGVGATPPTTSDRGHPMPRRSSPEKSVTLQYHRAAQEATGRAATGLQPLQRNLASRRRNSSDESHDTGQSDPKTWFDRSNRNPTATYDANSPDAEPPFFQKETDSSNEDFRDTGALRNPVFPCFQRGRPPLLRPTIAHSNSADDFRSVIDDLTVENKRLKEELKRYRQFGPDMMRKEKLFEIRVHGLPKRKKRELEATLRDFAASLEGSSETASQRRKPGRHAKNLYSLGESRYKRASSASSRSRPLDSAYASQPRGPSSNAPNSSGTSLGRPFLGARAKSSWDQNVENHIQDTPDGLLPRHVALTARERKRLVVRRLEQLFTGKVGGRNMHRNQSMPSMAAPPVTESLLLVPPKNAEAAREALIQPHEPAQKKAHSRETLSTSISNGDQTDSGGNGAASGTGGPGNNGQNTSSPPSASPPEQRPTRPRDLDPDRVQIPSENMDYIRHLGLGPAEELTAGKYEPHPGVAPDPDGWVYLNLLCNLAQLHIVNVTPGFIRSAVNEMSAKFQLSPDGRKIRWRGGTDGTRFSSDSGENSQKSPSSDWTDGSGEDGSRKKRKTDETSGFVTSAMSSKESKFGPNVSTTCGSKFHYKPLFVHHSSSTETSLEETGSQMSYDAIEESALGHTVNSRWDYSGSGSSRRKKRHDGAIIYYSGAPFCTDLSGDPGDLSPTSYMVSNNQEVKSLGDEHRGELRRSPSGSSLPIRPLSDDRSVVAEALDIDLSSLPDLVDDDQDTPNDEEMEFRWSSCPENVQLKPIEPPLEPCGLAGVMPDDHFAVVVTTRRTILTDDQVEKLARSHWSRPADTTDAVVGRLASMSTSSPLPTRSKNGVADGLPIKVEYLAGRIRRFKPVPLPPPAMFFPPFSTESDSDSDSDVADMDDDEDSDEQSMPDRLSISQRANPHHSDHQCPENEDLSSNDEEDEIDRDGEMDLDQRRRDEQAGRRPGDTTSASTGVTGEHPDLLHPGSSVATAGGAGSGRNSSTEDE